MNLKSVDSESFRRAEELAHKVTDVIRRHAQSFYNAEIEELQTGKEVRCMPMVAYVSDQRPTREEIRDIMHNQGPMLLAQQDARYQRILAYHAARNERLRMFVPFDEWYSAALSHSPGGDQQRREPEREIPGPTPEDLLVFRALDQAQKETGVDRPSYRTIAEYLHNNGFERTETFRKWQRKYVVRSVMEMVSRQGRNAKQKRLEDLVSRARQKLKRTCRTVS